MEHQPQVVGGGGLEGQPALETAGGSELTAEGGFRHGDAGDRGGVEAATGMQREQRWLDPGERGVSAYLERDPHADEVEAQAGGR